MRCRGRRPPALVDGVGILTFDIWRYLATPSHFVFNRIGDELSEAVPGLFLELATQAIGGAIDQCVQQILDAFGNASSDVRPDLIRQWQVSPSLAANDFGQYWDFVVGHADQSL